MRPKWPSPTGKIISFIYSSNICLIVKSSENRKSGSRITFQNYQTGVLTQELTWQNLKGRSSGLRRSFAKITNQPLSQPTTETVGLSRMKNKKLGVEYVTSMDTQKKTVSHHAGIANFQDIAIEIVLKGKIEEEAKAEEEQEEEMTQLLDKEDSHLKEENIPLIQKEKERKRETKVIGLEMTVLASQDQTQIDPADLSQDQVQTQNKTHLQEERSQKEVEDQTKTEEDTTRVTIIKMIELLLLTTTEDWQKSKSHTPSQC